MNDRIDDKEENAKEEEIEKLAEEKFHIQSDSNSRMNMAPTRIHTAK